MRRPILVAAGWGVLAAFWLGLPSAGAQVGTEMPGFTVTRWISDKSVKPEELKGRPYVVEFWATWCPPCRESIPHLVELTGKYEPMGLVIIGLTNEPVAQFDQIKKFGRDLRMNYYVGFNEELGQKLKVEGIPTAFVVGQDGRVGWTGHPMSPEFEPAMQKALGEWLFPGAKFPRTAAVARSVVEGKGAEGIAEIGKLAAGGDGAAEAGEALAVLERLAGAELLAIKERKEASPVQRVLDLREVARKHKGLKAAQQAASTAEEMTAAESKKDRGFGDELSVAEGFRSLEERLQAAIRESTRGAKDRDAHLAAVLRALEGMIGEYDALIRRYPAAKGTADVRASRDKMARAIEAMRRAASSTQRGPEAKP